MNTDDRPLYRRPFGHGGPGPCDLCGRPYREHEKARIPGYNTDTHATVRFCPERGAK